MLAQLSARSRIFVKIIKPITLCLSSNKPALIYNYQPLFSAPSKTSTASFFEYEMSVDPSLSTVAPVLPLQSGRRNFEDTQQNDYDDSGLPRRKKRSDDVVVEPKLLDDIKFSNNLEANQLVKPLDEAEAIHIDDNDISETEPFNIRVKRIDDIETKPDHDITNNILSSFDTKENGKVAFEEFIQKYLEYLTVLRDLDGNDNRQSRKRRRSLGHEYKVRGNKHRKSLWWRIVDGAQQQWSQVVMYEDKLVSQIADITSVLKDQLKGNVLA